MRQCRDSGGGCRRSLGTHLGTYTQPGSEMPISICLYEDTKYTQFHPISHLRPVFDMRAGIVPLYSRVERYFPGAALSLAVRDQLSALVADQHRDIPVGMIKRNGDDVLFLNGRIRDYGNLPELVTHSRLTTVFKKGDETIAVLFKRESTSGIGALAMPADYLRQYEAERADLPENDTTATLYGFVWDLIADIDRQIVADFEFVRKSVSPGENVSVHEAATLVNAESILMSNDVSVGPTAVIDASGGPVFIGANCRIEPQAAVFGPCFIGANSVVVAGKVSGSSIGHTCRVGGEVEESIFQAYVNKYHAGFIGHAYVGQWVNFGAMTTNSDLKNNYSNIRVSLNGKMTDSGSIKVGSFIGDHTKFGIGTLLNTGINIGVSCNLFGGKLIVDKEVPSFTWGDCDKYRKRYQIDKALETARVVADRRHHALSEREEELLQTIFDDNISAAGAIDFE